MADRRGQEFKEFPADWSGKAKAKRSTGKKIGIGCGALAVGFVVLGTIGAIVGEPDTGGNTTEPVVANSAAPATVSTSEASEKVELQVQAKALWQSVIAQSTRCDDAAKRVGAAGKTGNMYTLYPAAQEGAEICMDARMETDRLDPPAAADGDVEDAFEKAITECAAGHGMRGLAFQQLASVADGDMRPSKMAEVKETMGVAGRANLTCVASFYEAIGKAGLDMKTLEIK